MNAFEFMTNTLTAKRPSAETAPSTRINAIRAYLREHGPCTGAEVARAIGVLSSQVAASFRRELLEGRVTVNRSKTPYVYEYVENPPLSIVLRSAIERLRAMGYEVNEPRREDRND